MIVISVELVCDYRHEYLDPACKENRTRVATTATWNGSGWNVDLPEGWHQTFKPESLVHYTHDCPLCVASYRKDLR